MGYLHLPAPGEKNLCDFVRREWKSVRDKFSESVKRKGELYVSFGAVLPVKVEKTDAVFSSSGEYMPFYRIHLHLDGEALKGVCSCPYAGPCKHIYASLNLLFEGVSTGVKDVLMKMDKDELVELLIDYMPHDVRSALLGDPWDILEGFQQGKGFAALTSILPFVPLRYDTDETLNFLKVLMETLKDMTLPCPPTLTLTVRRTVKLAEDKVKTLLRIYELVVDSDCQDALVGVGDLLSDGEREGAIKGGIPYELLKGKDVPTAAIFSSAEACTDYILLSGLKDEEIRRLAEECMGRFGMFAPLVLLYLKAGGHEGVALHLLAHQPKASLLRLLKPMVSDETHRDLLRLLKKLSPKEYVKYVGGTALAKEILGMSGMLDRETFVEAVRENASLIGEGAIPILKEEIFRLSGSRKWSRYPYVAQLLRALRSVSRKEYENVLKEIRERYKGKRKLMEALDKVDVNDG